MSFGAEAYFDLEALSYNLLQVQKLAPSSKIMAMIKSNGYGHGLVEVTKALESIDAFGVACLEEAICLRKSGVANDIVVMRGFGDRDELEMLDKLSLNSVVHCREQLELLSNAKLKNPLKVWLKIDTGMHRLGFSPEEAFEVYKTLLSAKNVKKPIQIMTHLAESDDPGSKATDNQLNIFEEYCAGFCGERSIANSAAIINWPRSRVDWIRPGLMLYGAVPFLDKTGKDFGLKPVMTLKSHLVAVKKLRKGNKVGYGGVWRCPRDTVVGVAAIGYGDGYPRHAKNGTPILVAGRECKLIGRVSMDMLAIDLTNNPEARIGSEVVLWGDGLPVEIIARWADTIPYVLFCGITQRVRRIYAKDRV